MTDRPVMNAPTDAAAELKPCPVCGGRPHRNGRENMGSVLCMGAFHRVQIYGGTQAEADAHWNTRPPTDAAAVREAAARVQEEGRHAYIRDVGPALAPEHRSVAMAAYDAGWTDSTAAIRQFDLPGGEEVVDLPWKEPHPSHSYPNWHALVQSIRFEARIDTSKPAMYGRFSLSINGSLVVEKFDTVEAAKAYAQANFADRVRALHARARGAKRGLTRSES